MLDEQDIYICFRTVQSSKLNRPCRIPKDWNKHFETKFKPEQREALRKMKRYLATTWSNIDLEKYFACGFELYKTFSYHQFFYPQVLNLYIQKEKNVKRKTANIKAEFIKSAKYVKMMMLKENICSFKQYYSQRNGVKYVVVSDYIKNNVSSHFLSYLIYKGLISRDYCFSDCQIQEVVQKWHLMRNEVIDNIEFFDRVICELENVGGECVIENSKEKPILKNVEEEKKNLLLGTEMIEEKEESENKYKESKLIE